MRKLKKLLTDKLNILQSINRISLIALMMVLSWNINATTKIFSGEETGINSQNTVTGTVLDDQGTPLPGASVSVRGTSTGALTDFDGNYSVLVPTADTVLVFSYLGYKTQEISVGDQTTINVQMEVDQNSLEEVVVVGYGTQLKKDITGAISSVNSEELVLSSTPSIGQALQGRAAGLQIVQNSAQPGGGLTIQIRGAASINGSNEPLFVIDGFPISTDFGQPDSGNRYDNGSINPLNYLNPNDIESITVLKDASATAIYGARAGNGVVLITTKKGKAGKVSVTHSSSLSIQKNADEYDVLSLPEWMQVRNEAAFENWAFQNRIEPYSDRTLEEAIADPVNGVPFRRFYSDEQIRNAGSGTDWLGLVTRDGMIEQHNLTLQGGSEGTKYFMSGNLYEHQGVLKNSALDRASFRINLDQKIRDWMTFGINMTMSRIDNQNSQLGGQAFENSGIIRSAIQQSPIIPAINEDGTYPINPDNAIEPNPFSLLTITDNGILDRTLFNSYVEFRPLPKFTVRIQGGFDLGYTSRRVYLPRTTIAGEQENGRATVADGRKNDRLLDVLLNYKPIINEDHSFDILAGYSRQQFRSEENATIASGFETDVFRFDNLGAAESRPIVTSSKEETNIASFFGRLNYSYKDRYLLSSSIRRDGASTFAPNNQFGIFPSFSLGWNVVNEPFFQKLSFSDAFSQFKLRYGYGSVGNADVTTNEGLLARNWRSAFTFGPAYLNPDESLITGLFPVRLENRSLKWETTTETNVGLDFGFFNQRISGTIEYFDKEIEDLLQVVSLNSYHELNQVLSNVGTTQSKGLEVSLTVIPIETENFSWQSTFIYSHYRDRWKERGPNFRPRVFEGVEDPIRAQYSFLNDGIMQIGDEVPAQPDLVPGQIKIKDINGFERDASGDPVVDAEGRFIRTGAPDGIIDDADQVLLGSADPDFQAGFSSLIKYKNWSLNFNFNSLFGRRIIDPTDFVYGVSALGVAVNGRNALRSVLNRWTPENPSTTRPASHFGFNAPFGSGDFFLQDAWFIRLQNVSLSYALPQKLFGKNSFGASIRLDAQNLFVITDYKGLDPETDAVTAAYPNVRTYTLGIDLRF